MVAEYGWLEKCMLTVFTVPGQCLTQVLQEIMNGGVRSTALTKQNQ